MRAERLKSLFLQILIGCLVAAAGVAVVTILIGHMDKVSSKALVTILLVAVHSLASFEFISNSQKRERAGFERLNFLTNFVFSIIVLSFITSTLGVWHVISGDLVAQLYSVYLVLLFSVLHGELLANIHNKQASLSNVVRANYVFIAIVTVMLMPIIFVHDRSSLGSFYYRLLSAVGVVDATLTLSSIILHKLYLDKHPEIRDPFFTMSSSKEQGRNVIVRAFLLMFLIFFILPTIISLLIFIVTHLAD
jgi:hypothetical protein